MSLGSELYAREIACLVSTLVDGLRCFLVIARDELPDVTRKLRPWSLILNTESKNQAATDLLAQYAPLSGCIELIDLFSFSPNINSLEFLEPLHFSFYLQSPSTSICNYY